MEQTQHLRRSFLAALLALVMAFFAAAGATFAWYIYNTGAHTTSLHMAAGAGVSLQISNRYEGPYSSSAVLDSFVGVLDPVSTDSILGGFQKVTGFERTDQTRLGLWAAAFGAAESADYYKTTLYLRSNGGAFPVYLADIGYEDSDGNNPISTAIRVGLVVHDPGEKGRERQEYIFAISGEKNPERDYNTRTGREGYVLDSGKTDGTTVPFAPYTQANYCVYDPETGETALKPDSIPLLTLPGGEGAGTPVAVDVYIWLEGCDEDCTNNLCATTLKNVSLRLAGYSR